jgi:hypothetical protein
MSMEQEIWHIESGGHIVDTNFEELTTKIEHGELLRMDRVSKGNLRWIEAGKVPSLMAVFNALDGEQAPKPVITLTKLGPTSMPGGSTVRRTPNSGPNTTVASVSAVNAAPVCAMHEDMPASYVCDTCFSNFCKACTKSFGTTVKICPYCGAMCSSIEKIETARVEAVKHSDAMSSGFGFGDFISALAYPFRFKVSLVLGALMYMFFSIGTGAAGFGGFIMMGAALGSYMLMNTLRFGVLANTVENFAQGKVDSDFMPAFEDFSVWDDVVHPFFLSIGVGIASFGPLILLSIVTFFFALNSATGAMNGIQSDAARAVNPSLPSAAIAAKQSQAVRELVNRTNERQKQRIEEMSELSASTEGNNVAQQSTPYTNAGGSDRPVVDQSEETVMRANELIQKTQKAQLEAALGKTPETRSAEQWALVKQILAYGFVFLLIGGLCLLWGLFYFPAACAVAGYTRSFTATLNPSVGIDTIKRLGVDYVKILLMGLAIMIMSGGISGILAIIFLPFNMPGLGNLPAGVIGSLFGFYFSVVFSCVLGFAMYKASDRLKLPS